MPAWSGPEARRGHERGPLASATLLRFLATVHRLVLSGRAPALAALYPSTVGCHAGTPGLALRGAPGEHVGAVRAGTGRPTQTDEPGRSAAPVGAFLLVARRGASSSSALRPASTGRRARQSSPLAAQRPRAA